jgi:hypothetical protein
LLIFGDDAAGIYQAQVAATPGSLAIEAVAGDAGLVPHNGPTTANDAVKERGFAHVGTAYDGEGRRSGSRPLFYL